MEMGGGIIVIKNVFFKIILPSILFAAVLFLPKTILRGGSFDYVAFAKDTLLGGCYWFTSALAVAELMVVLSIACGAKKLRYLLLLSIIFSILSNLLYYNDIWVFDSPSLPWFYKSGMIAFFFMILGGYYLYYENKIDDFFEGRKSLYLIAFTTLYCLVMLYKSEYIHWSITRGQLGIWGLIMIVISVYLIIWVCKRIPSNRFTEYIGRHTLGMYLLCGAFPNISCIVLAKSGLPIDLLSVSICAIVSFFLSFATCFVLYRYLPFVFDFRQIKHVK